MANNLTVVLVDDKAQEIMISIEMIGANMYRLNLDLYGVHFAMAYPLMPTDRAVQFKKIWWQHKQAPDNKVIKIAVLNLFFGEEIFSIVDPIDIIEMILQVLRQQVISAHFIDKNTGLPIKPRCIHQAEQLLDVPNDPMLILDKAGNRMKQITPEPESDGPVRRRKLTL